MALLLIDGFEQYGTPNELSRGGWSAPLAHASVHTIVDGRIDGQAIQMWQNVGQLVHGVPASTTFTCGFAYNFKLAGPDGNRMVYFRNSTTVHITLQSTNAGELVIQGVNGFTTLETTSGLGMVIDTWYYIELEATIGNSGSYDVQVDGVSVMSDSGGSDTQNGATTTVDNISFQGDVNIKPYVDDVYFLDTTGSDNTGLLGDSHVETVYPDGDGNENDFMPEPSGANYLNVDDSINSPHEPDDDTTYNWSATATDRELYTFSALTGSIGTVYGVDAKMLCRKEDAGSREVRVIARSSTSEVESANLSLGVDYVYKNEIFENNPNGGGDWTESTVNAAEFGLDLQV